MSSATIPISHTAHQVLSELAQKTGQSMEQIVDHAVEDYRRKVFLEAVNAGYSRMRSESQTWRSEQESRKAWDVTLLDGLTDDERWTDDGRAINADEKDAEDAGSESR